MTTVIAARTTTKMNSSKCLFKNLRVFFISQHCLSMDFRFHTDQCHNNAPLRVVFEFSLALSTLWGAYQNLGALFETVLPQGWVVSEWIGSGENPNINIETLGFLLSKGLWGLKSFLTSFSGGATQTRTGGGAFAELCLTTWLWRRLDKICSFEKNMT